MAADERAPERMGLSAYIESRLSSGDLTLGQRLPPERELAQILGCSRHKVRQQMDMLERRGSVTRTVGRGTLLRSTPQPRNATPMSSSPSAIIEARMAWEPRLMTLVAVRATVDDFAELQRCLRDGVDATEPDDCERVDHDFHRALALAAHNEVVTRVHGILEDSRRQLAWGRLRRDIYTPANWTSCQGEHTAIAAAIADRNADAAASLMRAHLQSVRRQLLGNL